MASTARTKAGEAVQNISTKFGELPGKVWTWLSNTVQRVVPVSYTHLYSSVVAYTSVFPFTTHMIPDEEAVNALYAVGRNHLTGEEAEFEYCRVELWDTKTEGKFAARKFTVSAETVSYTHLLRKPDWMISSYWSQLEI